MSENLPLTLNGECYAPLAACHFSGRQDLLAQLLALNQTVAAQIEKGVPEGVASLRPYRTPVTAPGLPSGTKNPAAFVTADCIRSAAG